MNDPDYWFPAKRYGWGWGLPTHWQGWLVLAVYVAALVAVGVLVRPDRHRWAFIALVALLSAGLIGVCWLKGEPPRWRS
ncbi:hypothetical protein [Paraburkholderia acidisoli]|uniref:Uncharacterized protein n=1 Tax=Paraburkholderia acidisoli TaxID=2571748 RepID=A0A7Z2GMJ4_9BURK|nr:hypothetical protein [Paraburkholderia acidisoli]QGZ64304.1 hypothetical protein FAZ98_21520 [Paraburkholderia acidisoli]